MKKPRNRQTYDVFVVVFFGALVAVIVILLGIFIHLLVTTPGLISGEILKSSAMGAVSVFVSDVSEAVRGLRTFATENYKNIFLATGVVGLGFMIDIIGHFLPRKIRRYSSSLPPAGKLVEKLSTWISSRLHHLGAYLHNIVNKHTAHSSHTCLPTGRPADPDFHRDRLWYPEIIRACLPLDPVVQRDDTGTAKLGGSLLSKFLRIIFGRTHSTQKIKGTNTFRPKWTAYLTAVTLAVYTITTLLTPTQAAWFSNDWLYRKTVTISLASGTQTNYQIELQGSTLGISTLVSTGKLNSDCSDIRFTDRSGNSLPYWVEEKSDTTDTPDCTTDLNVWVKVPTLSPGDNTLYFYYGNSTAPSESDPNKVFEFFDNFENASLDNTNRWNVSGTVGSSSASRILTLDNGDVIQSKSTVTDASGLGRLIVRAKQAATNLVGSKLGFTNASSTSTHFNNDDSATLIIGSEEEQIASTASTNLVSYYKLEETTSTDANQFKASGFFDTGKLNQGVSMYGNAAGTQGSKLTFNRGAQISGNNYENINNNQGTVSFWLKPSWNGNDGLDHRIVVGSAINGLSISKLANSTLEFSFANVLALGAVDVSSWTANSWYYLTFRWNQDSTLDGTNYASISINGSTTGIRTSAFSVGEPPINTAIGSHGFYMDGRNSVNALIDDFAIFDRVLSTTEITDIYNAGTGREAGYVADSSLKFYAKLDGSGTLAPVVYNSAASASKMQAASSELSGGTNLVADGDMEDVGVTSWPKYSGDTVTKVTSGVAFDNQVIEVKSTVGAAGMAIQDFTTVSGNEYIVSGWLKNGSSSLPQVYIDSPVFSRIVSYSPVTSATWTHFNFSFKAGSTTSRIYLRDGNGNGGTVLFDNISITSNLVVNGGMEGTYSAGVAPSWTSFDPDGAATFTDETTIVHSGGHAQKMVFTSHSNSSGIAQDITVVANTKYLVTAWIRADTGGSAVSILAKDSNWSGAGSTLFTVSPAYDSAYHKLSAIVTPTQTTLGLIIRNNASATMYVDDVSIIPLSNVSTSFQAYTPVADTPGANSAELLSNTGFETAGAGGADVFGTWTESTSGSSTLSSESSIFASGSKSAKFVVDSSNSNTSVYQSVSGVVGKTYNLSFWTKGDSGKQMAFDLSGISTNNTVNLTDNWQKVSYNFIFTGASNLTLKRWTASTTFYVDDVSIKEVANPLSVHGDSDGVASNATGARGNAYTFDGFTGYLRQKTYDVNIGTLTYADTNTDISDTGQEFEDYDNDDAGQAEYMIVVTNSDNTTSWGYFCANDGGTQTAVYTKKACTGGADGFNGTSPSGKTPVGYEVRKTDYQYSANQTIGTWIYPTDISDANWIMQKKMALRLSILVFNSK